MVSFLTLMDANQLSLAEQKQVYETIKDDYEKLLKVFDRTKRGSDLSDIDLDAYNMIKFFLAYFNDFLFF
jgi:hypothetical protein